MAEFLAELRRRHIYRIGAGYVVVAWGIAQVIDFLSQVWALPDWIAQPVSLVLAVGFPVVLIAAWMIVGAAKEGGTQSEIKKATATDWALVSALVAVLAFMGYQQVAPSTATVPPSNAAASIAGDIVQDVAGKLPNSVAVLPFANVSPDPDDEYFAVGIHDEILNKLQSLQNLSVIARASVMKYADTAMTIPEIADELNVETIMSGSVRLAGDQVLVNAELIDGESNLTVWSDQYPGNLSDIFGIQADIAMNIANALRAEFSVEEQENIEARPTDSPEAYDAYLKALAVFKSDILGTEAENERRIVQDYLDEALALDPNFGLAHAWKAYVYAWSKRFDPISEEDWPSFSNEMDRLIDMNIEQALAIDPEIGLAHVVRAAMLVNSGRLEDAQDAGNQALRSSPNDVEVLFQMSFIERQVGDAEQALAFSQRALELDPNTAQRYNDLADHLRLSGRYDEAAAAYQECLDLNPADTGCSRSLGRVEFFRGNKEAALAALRQAEAGRGPGTLAVVAWGYGVMGEPDDAQRAFESLRAAATEQYVDPVRMAQGYLGIRDTDEALRLLTLAADNPDLIKDHPSKRNVAQNEWHDPILDEPRFETIISRLR